MTVSLTSTDPNAEKNIKAVMEANGLEVEEPESNEDQPKSAAADPDKKERSEPQEDEPQAKPSRFQRRVERATAELRRQNEDLRARLEVLEGGGEEEQPDQRPQREQFESDEDFQDALVEWRVAQQLAAREAQQAEEAQNSLFQQTLSNYRSQVEQFQDEHEDWDETVRQDLPMHTGVQLAIMEMPNAPEVLYYMGKHPDYTKKLAEMSPLGAVMEVGRLSDKLSAGRSKGQSPAANGSSGQTKPSPRPVQPVRTGTVAPVTSLQAAESRDYKAFKRAQREGR